MNHNLAMQLREGTQKSHALAENTAFMKCFLKGVVERDPFRHLIANLYFIYSALEEEMRRHAHHSVVGTLYFPSLERVPQLEKDLAFYYGKNWRGGIMASSAGLHYIERIHQVANQNPSLLVAHAYVRYMGDLSGGQALKAIIRSALQLPEGYGTAFYEFDDIFDDISTVEARRAFKGQYRDALNSLPIEMSLVRKIVDEANVAFRLDCNIVNELEPLVKAAIGEHVFDLITRQDTLGRTEYHHRSPTVSTELVSSVTV
ncbi:heme oxygenase (biliverdin-producing) [Leptothoe sp. ISB3NOV94-8A]|uniref:heme oxygenase (biliverdin-producing) n=1 Tax=Adonisia turfae CCMR0081 TaxID=2292702 RepID=A0A6M0RTD2_9CYAN|nr:heme oxygenase (biliverdin-producing) [Adonisia turfae]MDV3347215.1 heme oxygenase (biliverdin-producing) [Leptothoe sp. LEGE 181152]NEZ59023.1 heme oxygenase (biliverdin-producing) [Adonisia turfae CCMR0081]